MALNDRGGAVPPGRRLTGGLKKESKYANNNPNMNEGQRLAALEKARDNLGHLVENYIKLLVEKTLPENRSAADKEHQKGLLDQIPRAAAELDIRNVGEGGAVVYSTCLNSILVLRDEINKGRYQNHFLKQEIAALKKDIDEMKENKSE